MLFYCAHNISCTQQDRQREPSVKTLRWYCVLSGGSQRRALPLNQSKVVKIYILLNISLPRVGITPQPDALTHLCPCATTT